MYKMVRLSEIIEEPIYPELMDELKFTVRQLLLARGNSTISELKQDYATKIGDGWLPDSFREIAEFLRTIPDVVCRSNTYGLNMWTVQHQRPKRTLSGNSSNSNHSNAYRSKRPRMQKCPNEGFYYSFQLIGDDFFYDLVTRSLNVKSSVGRSNRRVAGMCETGMLIRNAERKVLQTEGMSKRVIVHVGSYDVLVGRDFYSIKRDLESLMRAFKMCQIDPVICTISPIANQAFNKTIRSTWHRVNEFIRAQDHWNVLDLCDLFMVGGSKINFDLFVPFAARINGSRSNALSLWNHKGRVTILDYIKDAVIAHNSTPDFY